MISITESKMYHWNTDAKAISVVRKERHTPGGNHHSIAAKVQDFQKQVKFQGQGHKL